jgi:lysyl-tRNA synthetase class 2
MTREEQIIKERLRKLQELKEKGINPYPAKFEKKHDTAELQKKYKKLKPGKSTKNNVKVAGRNMVKRMIGGICFGCLHDSSGNIQLVFMESVSKSAKNFFDKYIDLGDILGVEGNIIRTKRGELSIAVKKIQILSKSILPLPEKWHGLQDKEERYRKRYLDLIMNPGIKDIFEKRRKIFNIIREFMTSKGFIEVQTPILQPIYGGASARPFESKLNALKMKVYMRISNELYLKRLIVGGYEKIFEFSPDFRNEGIDRMHNPEFTQVETMWAYADYKDNMKFAEEMISFVVKKICGKTKIKVQGKDLDFKSPWKKIKFLDAIKKETKLDLSRASSLNETKKIASKLGMDCSKCESIGEIMLQIFEEKVQSKIIQPTLVYDYPIEAAGLAKCNREDGNFVASFEVIINGMEIGLSYCEQNDPAGLERYWRFAQMKYKGGDLEAQQLDNDSRCYTLSFYETRGIKMVLPINREQAWELVKKHNTHEQDLIHYLESEAVMRELAKKLGEDEEYWGMLGLVHDIDWGLTKENISDHLTKAPELLKEAGFDQEFIDIVVSHGYGFDVAGLKDKKRIEKIQHALAASETITGLIHAYALMRGGRISDMQVKGLKKKFKDKTFAAKVSRDVIRESEQLGITLDEFFEIAIEGIKKIAKEVDLT